MRTGLPLLLLHDLAFPVWFVPIYWGIIAFFAAIPVFLLVKVVRMTQGQPQSSTSGNRAASDALTRKHHLVSAAIGLMLGAIHFATVRSRDDALFVALVFGLGLRALLLIGRKRAERNRSAR